MPIDPGLVAGLPEQLGKRDLAAVEDLGVVAQAVEVAVLSRQDDGPARGADAVRAEAVVEPDALAGDAVHGRRRVEPAPVAAHGLGRVVVGHDEEDVRAGRRILPRRAPARPGGRDGGRSPSHGLDEFPSFHGTLLRPELPRESIYHEGPAACQPPRFPGAPSSARIWPQMRILPGWLVSGGERFRGWIARPLARLGMRSEPSDRPELPLRRRVRRGLRLRPDLPGLDPPRPERRPGQLDGRVAELSGRTSRFGAILDSTLDRYAEFALFGGLIWHFRDELARRPRRPGLGRIDHGQLHAGPGRGPGRRVPGGLAQRPERFAAIGTAAFFGFVFPVFDIAMGDRPRGDRPVRQRHRGPADPPRPPGREGPSGQRNDTMSQDDEQSWAGARSPSSSWPRDRPRR